MRIYFLRHGKANYKKDKLTQLGKKEAKMASLQFGHENIKKIYSSPALRCVQTAKIISKKLGVDFEIINEIHERNKIKNPLTETEIEVNDNYLNYNYENESYFTCKNYIDQNINAIKKLVEKHLINEENFLIIAHSSTAYALNAYINGIPRNGKIKWMKIGNCSKLCYEKDKV